MNFISSMFWRLFQLLIFLLSPCLVFLTDPLLLERDGIVRRRLVSPNWKRGQQLFVDRFVSVHEERCDVIGCPDLRLCAG